MNIADTLGTSFAVLVSLVLPLAALAYFIYKKNRYYLPFLLGAATFAVFQILTRIPLLGVLNNQVWFINLTAFYPIIHLAFLAVTAALFEELGRFAVMKLFMRRNQRWLDGISFGLGHGGFEAIMLVGINAVAVLIIGGVAFGLVEGQGGMFWGGVERLLTIPVHVAWSVMVLQSVVQKRYRYLYIALFTHALTDFGIVMLASFTTLSVLAVEGVLAVFTLAAIIYIIASKKSFRSHELNG